jgi:hypothetical protein
VVPTAASLYCAPESWASIDCGTMKRAKRRTKSNQRGSERSRLMIVLVAMAVIMATGLFATRRLEITQSSTTNAGRPNDAEIYTGSILFELNDGKICRQLFFDNRTGLTNDHGMVDCARAYYRGINGVPMQLSAARAQVISDSFRHH